VKKTLVRAGPYAKLRLPSGLFLMRSSQRPDPRHRLLPEGRRWGFGAHSVVPYLTAMQSSRLADEPGVAGSIRNPVFPQMEHALRQLRQGH
jgi:hypothetical protein